MVCEYAIILIKFSIRKDGNASQVDNMSCPNCTAVLADSA
jgi:hypothetical protein